MMAARITGGAAKDFIDEQADPQKMADQEGEKYLLDALDSSYERDTAVSEIKRQQGNIFVSKKVFSSLSLERFSINRCFPHFFSRVPCSFSKRLEFLSTFGHHA